MNEEKRQSVVPGLSRNLAEFTVEFKIDGIPEIVLDNAKIAILDCLGVSLRGAAEEIGEILLRFARKNFAPGPCTVWGSDIRTNPRDAALLNATLAHGLDYDDRGHASTYTLASSIAAAESNKASGARVLEAFIVGREVRMCLDRLFSARLRGAGPGARGWHSNGILGPIACACAASKVFGLGVNHTLAAIGLATGSCGALTRDGGTMAKPFRAGQAAATGLTCALLAEEGLTSDTASIEGNRGLLDALGPIEEDILETLGKDLGVQFDLANPGVKAKLFPCCTGTHAGLEAMLRLRANRPIRPNEIHSIELDIHPNTLLRTDPEKGFEGRFSLPFCLGIALIYGPPTPEHFTDAYARDPGVRDVVQKTRHVPGSKQLILNLTDGTKLAEPVTAPTDLTTWKEVRDKFEGCAKGILSESKQFALLDAVGHLEEIPSLAPLCDNLRGCS
jgi:2-methylcitrate dehydratase PrpD